MPISGKDMVKLFEARGWKVIRQKGSHITMAKGADRATIPNHRELKKGTEHSIRKKLK